MILVDVAVKLVGAALRDERNWPPLPGRSKPRCRQRAVKLLDRIDRCMSNDGAELKPSVNSGARVGLHSTARCEIIYVQAIQGDVILIDACARHRTLYRSLRAACVKRAVGSFLCCTGRLLSCFDVEGVADGCARGIDRDFGVGGGHLNRGNCAPTAQTSHSGCGR